MYEPAEELPPEPDNQRPPEAYRNLALPEMGEESRIYWENWEADQTADARAAAHFGAMLHRDQERFDTSFFQ